jgi:hypothetical protein
MYVEDESGERIACGHPCEDSVVERVLGVSFDQIGLSVFDSIRPRWWWLKKKRNIYSLIREKTGYNSFCICLDCLNKMALDLGDEKSKWRSQYGYNRAKDARICGKCNSHNVRTLAESVDRLCPVCKKGKIAVIFSGTVC